MQKRLMDPGDVLIGLYGALCFLCVTALPTVTNPLIHEAMLAAKKTSLWDATPCYSLGQYVCLFPVVVFVLYLFRAPICRAILRRPSGVLAEIVYTFLAFEATCLAVAWNFGEDASIMMAWGTGMGGLFALIAGLRAVRPEGPASLAPDACKESQKAFLSNTISEWKWGLGIFSGILMATIVAGGIGFVRDASDVFGAKGAKLAVLDLTIRTVVIVVGAAVGVYWQVFDKVHQCIRFYLDIPEETKKSP